MKGVKGRSGQYGPYLRNGKRAKATTVPLTDQEHSDLYARADSAGMTGAEYVRSVLWPNSLVTKSPQSTNTLTSKRGPDV